MRYKEIYKSKLVSCNKALEYITSNSNLGLSYGESQPIALLNGLAKKAQEGNLQNINVYYLHTSEHTLNTIFTIELLPIFHPYPMTGVKAYSQKRFTQAVGKSLSGSSIIPCNFSEAPRFFEEKIKLDTFILTVSPIDKSGFFSLGIANAYSLAAARNCKNLLVEVNKHMPRVFGNSMLHVDEITAITENDVPLPEIVFGEPSEEDLLIGKQVIELIPDEATIQIGLGNGPNAICNQLGNHKDLGIHTELLTPELIKLIKENVVTGRKKNIHREKHLFTICMGDKKCYDFINDHPSFESYPVSYTNDPCVIAKNNNLISINSVFQVDLFGQANCEIIGGKTLSGPGGQNDFVKGAYASKGGKSILAFKSTAKNGQVSRIVLKVDFVTDSRMDVQYVATEYGVVNLKGETVAERARALIKIAHPDFRQNLYDAAKKNRIIG